MYDRTTVKEGAITFGHESIEEMGCPKITGVTPYPCVVDPLATHSLFSVSLAGKDHWHYEQGGGQATLCHSQQHRRTLLSKFGGLHVLEHASSMLACEAEATTEIKIMACDDLVCRIPKMTEMEPANQPFYVRDGVSLDQL